MGMVLEQAYLNKGVPCHHWELLESAFEKTTRFFLRLYQAWVLVYRKDEVFFGGGRISKDSGDFVCWKLGEELG